MYLLKNAFYSIWYFHILEMFQVKNQLWAKPKNIPLEIPLRILKTEKGTLNPNDRGTLTPQTPLNDNTLLRGVKTIGCTYNDGIRYIRPLAHLQKFFIILKIFRESVGWFSALDKR